MIFGMSDLHLSLTADKPMDVFGGDWHNYVKRIEDNWQSVVGTNDIVVIPGDISWAMKLEDALSDFSFIDRLNGRKIISKGNHDYFWETSGKMNAFFGRNGISTIGILHNNYFKTDGCCICGTKGYNVDDDESAAQNEKLLARECMRLENSLRQAAADGGENLLAFLHYPPIGTSYEITPITDMLRKYGVERCFYGHLHGKSRDNAFEGEKDGVAYKLISADHLKFRPFLIVD